MGRIIRCSSCLLLACVLLLPGLLQSTAAQERELTLEEKATESELIVEGKVTSIRSEWNAEHTRIYTHVTITVTEYLKGEPSEQTVVVTHLGGEVGEVGEIYSGAVRFEEDEEVLVFLNRDQQGRYGVTGGSQGKYSVSRDESTNERMVAKSKPLRELKQEILRIVKL